MKNTTMKNLHSGYQHPIDRNGQDRKTSEQAWLRLTEHLQQSLIGDVSIEKGTRTLRTKELGRVSVITRNVWHCHDVFGPAITLDRLLYRDEEKYKKKCTRVKKIEGDIFNNEAFSTLRTNKRTYRPHPYGPHSIKGLSASYYTMPHHLMTKNIDHVTIGVNYPTDDKLEIHILEIEAYRKLVQRIPIDSVIGSKEVSKYSSALHASVSKWMPACKAYGADGRIIVPVRAGEIKDNAIQSYLYNECLPAIVKKEEIKLPACF